MNTGANGAVRIGASCNGPMRADEGLDAARMIRAERPDTAIILLSAHVGVDEATELLAGGDGVGYLLKSRVTDVAETIETVGASPNGPRWWTRPWCRCSSILDVGVIRSTSRHRDEREVLALMAEGASNAGIADRIFVSEGTVEKHVRSILTKLDLPESATGHRRVLAVLMFLATH